MLRVIKNSQQSSLFWVLAIFSFIYLGIAFPFSYFRHDDWLMIGNVARIVPSNWKFIFQPYLIFNSVPEVWFFRPWFKLILYLLYQSLGFYYYGWLAINLLFTLGTLVFGYLTIKETTRESSKSLIFILFFVFSVHFHFASLVWVGEGTMNCPQIFLLFLNFYLFSKSLNQKNTNFFSIYYSLAFFVFTLSLGFKEAAVFHLPFLLLLLFHPSQSVQLSLRKKITLLVPYFILACAYLYFRLYLIPFNPGYKPRGDLSWFLTPILFLLASLSLPLGSIMMACLRNKQMKLESIKSLFKTTSYFVFLIPFFITYMGHGFFSPGWLLAPGFYYSFILGLYCPKPLQQSKVLLKSVIFTFILSTGLVLYQTNELSWWSWYRPQRQILEIIKDVGSFQTETINVYNCEEPNQKSPHLHRVVGYSDSIQEIFWLTHKKLPKVNELPCTSIENLGNKSQSNTLSLVWRFPEFTLLP